MPSIIVDLSRGIIADLLGSHFLRQMELDSKTLRCKTMWYKWGI